MAFSPPEYCRLFAQKKAYQGGVTGTPGPPLATPLSGERCEVKKAMKSRGGLGRELKQSMWSVSRSFRKFSLNFRVDVGNGEKLKQKKPKS